MIPPINGWTSCPVCRDRTFHVAVMSFPGSRSWILGKCEICDFVHEIKDMIYPTDPSVEPVQERTWISRLRRLFDK